MSNKSLVSINDLTKEEILELIEKASHFEANPNRDILAGKVVATLFFDICLMTCIPFVSLHLKLENMIFAHR